MIDLFSKPRGTNAFKVALSTVIATLIALAMQVPYPFWSGSVAILLLSEHMEGTWTRGIDRLFGTITGILVGLVVFHFALQNSILLMICLFVIVFISIIGFLSRGNSWLVFGISAYFVILYAIVDPADSFSAAIWRGVAIAIGVAVTVCVNNLFFPVSAATKLNELLIITAKQFSDFFNCYIFNKENNSIVLDQKELTNLAYSADKILQLSIAMSQNVKTMQRANYQTYGKKMIALSNSLKQLATFVTGQPKFEFTPELISLNENLIDLLQHLPTNFIDPCSTKTLTLTWDALTRFINSIEIKRLDNHKINFQLYIASLDNCIFTIQEILETQIAICEKQTLVTNNASTRKSLFKFVTDFYNIIRSRPDWAVHAAKVGAAVIITTYILVASGWYSGICAGISILAVGTDDIMSKVNLKSWLRLLGTVCGIACSVFFVIFIIRDIVSLAVILFIGSYYFGYIAGGNFKQMYFGWMAAMAFVITVVPDIQTTTSLDFTLERAAALIFGLLVITLVNYLFWPAETQKLLQKKQVRCLAMIGWFWEILSTIQKEKSATFKQDLETVMLELNTIEVYNNQLVASAGENTLWQEQAKAIGLIRQIQSHLSRIDSLSLQTVLTAELLANFEIVSKIIAITAKNYFKGIDLGKLLQEFNQAEIALTERVQNISFDIPDRIIVPLQQAYLRLVADELLQLIGLCKNILLQGTSTH